MHIGGFGVGQDGDLVEFALQDELGLHRVDGFDATMFGLLGSGRGSDAGLRVVRNIAPAFTDSIAVFVNSERGFLACSFLDGGSSACGEDVFHLRL